MLGILVLALASPAIASAEDVGAGLLLHLLFAVSGMVLDFWF